jgi:hypothetical protein
MARITRLWMWCQAQLPWHKPVTRHTREGWTVCPCGKYGFEEAARSDEEFLG